MKRALSYASYSFCPYTVCKCIHISNEVKSYKGCLEFQRHFPCKHVQYVCVHEEWDISLKQAVGARHHHHEPARHDFWQLPGGAHSNYAVSWG